MGVLRNLSTSVLGITAAIGLAPGIGVAADIVEPPVYEAPEVVPLPVGGWYLRGDIGMSNQQLHGRLENALFATTDNFGFLDPGTFSAAPTFRAGIGYQFSPYFRADATVEYRGKADFSAMDRLSCAAPCGDDDPATWDGTNSYTAKKREWLIMANAYLDLGTWQGVTPYVGAGIGAAQVTISGFQDHGFNLAGDSSAYGGNHSQWNLAWALHAGLGFQVNDRLTLDLGYSYLNLGDGESGDLIAFDGTNTINNPMIFKELVSHDFKFGLRYALK